MGELCKMPTKYRPLIDLKETENAIKIIKDNFQISLSKALNLRRVTAPLFVRAGTGINDDLNGLEKPVSFVMKDDGSRVEIVQSLAKWKRMSLADYHFGVGEGLYTDMNALRPDECLDNLHSIYVDQWDWERIMANDERNLDFLKNVVEKIYDTMRSIELVIEEFYPQIKPILPEKIKFIHTEDLEEKYPDFSPIEREYYACKEHGAIFLIGIGGKLKSGKPHDGRAPDYDDWSTPTGGGKKGMNGDIIVWNPVLERAFELSSMGIRVDPAALDRQLTITGKEERRKLLFHKRLLEGKLPQTIGGGIGQSRLCMFYLRKAHIGEVQSSVWPEKMIADCAAQGIVLL